jgi:hypothetical protein
MRLRKIVLGSAAILSGEPIPVFVRAVAALYTLFHFPCPATVLRRPLTSSGEQCQYLLYVPTTHDQTEGCVPISVEKVLA